MLQSAFVYLAVFYSIGRCYSVSFYRRSFNLVLLRFNSLAVFLVLTVVAAGSVFGQDPTPTPAATPASVDIIPPSTGKNGQTSYTAEQIVVSSQFIYGLGGGKAVLDQIRKTTFERGKAQIAEADGKMIGVSYQRWIKRGDTLAADNIRLELDYPNARYSMLYADAKVNGIYNDSIFTPREDAVKSFDDQNFRSIDALLRYKENESTIEVGEKQKILGVDLYVIDLTDKQGRKTKYYISVKSLRVMMLEYEDGGVKFQRRFYDYRYAQGTLVPYRTVLLRDEKMIEEYSVGTITYGQKVDDGLFVTN